MAQGYRGASNRHRRGSGTVKFVVWGVLLFGLYAGHAFMPVACAKSQVERAAETALEDISHDASDAAIRRSVAKRMQVASFPVDEETVLVHRESRPGERIVHVALAHPTSVNFLGSERVIVSEIEKTRVFQVDEATLARREKATRDRREAIERDRAMWEEAYAECQAIHGEGNCSFTGHPDGSGELERNY
jgi:hypothetical protein